MLHQLNTCINNSTQKKPTADARKSDEEILNQTVISTRKNKEFRAWPKEKLIYRRVLLLQL